MDKIKTVLINNRYLIVFPEGVIYDILKARDIPQWVFEIKERIEK